MPKKIKLKLTDALLAIFFLALAVELLVLYQYVFVNVKYKALAVIPEKPPTAKIDLSVYDQVRSWLSEKEKYKVPVYSLQKTDSGRENPFAEYR